MKSWINDFIHNVIIHPLMVLLPSKLATNMHDKHAAFIWGENKADELSLEDGRFNKVLEEYSQEFGFLEDHLKWDASGHGGDTLVTVSFFIPGDDHGFLTLARAVELGVKGKGG